MSAISADKVTVKASDYDRLVNWKKRLAREWPFYERLFRKRGVASILDCACGTGRHAILFAQKGFTVTATDIDREMIARARRNAEGKGAELAFKTAAFSELARVFPSHRFDAVICVGNSLSQLPGADEVREALRNMAAVCRAGGLLVLHLLNYNSLLKKSLVASPLRVTGEEGRRQFFQKIFVPRPSLVEVIVVKIRENGGAWSSEVTAGSLLPIMPSFLEPAVTDAGFSPLERFGDYAGSAFDTESSWDFILTAVRSA